MFKICFSLDRVLPVQGGLDPTKGDFDWSEIDQSRSVGAETSYVPFFISLYAWLTCAQLIRSIKYTKQVPKLALVRL